MEPGRYLGVQMCTYYFCQTKPSMVWYASYSISKLHFLLIKAAHTTPLSYLTSCKHTKFYPVVVAFPYRMRVLETTGAVA
jgi:hypothetical protein